MNITIKTLQKEQQTVYGLYVEHTHVPNSSLIEEDLSDKDKVVRWISEDIDDVVKAKLILGTSDIKLIPPVINSALCLALYLQNPHNDIIEKLNNLELSDNIFPIEWNINTPRELNKLIKNITPDLCYSYLSALNKNSIIINKHKYNKTPISKSTLTHTKTKSVDVLSWSTSFIKMLDDEIRGFRDTHQVQKIEDTFKIRSFSAEEKVEEHIARELLPFRHRVDNTPESICELIAKLEKLNISKTVLIANEINRAIENNNLSKLIIEQTLKLKWEHILLQVTLLKESGKDNIEIVEELQMSININIPEENLELPLF